MKSGTTRCVPLSSGTGPCITGTPWIWKSSTGRRGIFWEATTDSRERGDMTRTITKSEWSREGNLVVYRVAADGFLYNMVRILVGTMLRVAQGKFQPEEMPEILEAKNRNRAGPTAPACGLWLDQVFYEGMDLSGNRL